MKATLIAQSAASADDLRKRMFSEGVDVVLALQRKPQESLQPLLGKAQGDMLVVECDGPLGGDLAALSQLTQLNPRMPVLLLCAEQDSATLLAAMRAGVREVLPAHPAPAEFAGALRRIAQRTAPAQDEGPHARVIAVLPCKGGSGSTMLATNLAYAIAADYGKRTALLDLDLQYGDAAYYVSDGRARASLADLARQVERLDASLLDSSMIDVAPNFKLLAAPEEPEAALGITGLQLERVIDLARAHYDFVVLDIERMLDPLSIRALDKADEIFLVAQNMVPHMRNARRLVRMLRALGYENDRLRLVVNRFERRGGIELTKFEEVVGLKVAHVLRENSPEVADAVNTGVPIVQLHPGCAVSREIREIARTLAEPPAARRSWLGRLIHEEA